MASLKKRERSGDDAAATVPERLATARLPVTATPSAADDALPSAALITTLQQRLRAISDKHAAGVTAYSGEGAPAEEFRLAMTAIATTLLHDATIVATDAKTGATQHFLIAEVELYVNHKTLHPDAFTHGDKAQERVGEWYFHKKGGTYKAGSFKGLDVTFGWAGVPCGCLIRSIQPVDGVRDGAAGPACVLFADRPLVEGPSLVVDALLAATGRAKVIDLAGGADVKIPVESAGIGLVLSHTPNRGRRADCGVLRAPRVGLVPRTVDSLRFAGRLYRFIALPPGKKERIAKVRAGVAAALFVLSGAADVASTAVVSNDQAVAAVVAITGGVKKSTAAVLAAVRAGAASGAGVDKRRDALLGADVTKAEVIAGIIGYCHGHVPAGL